MEGLKAALADRYTLERKLGRGGMGTVYLAKDLRHHRLVAIKMLHPGIAASLGVERFLREIRIEAGLTHPHILPLHDSGEAAGLLYYVMPYVEGETLRERLLRQGRLPLSDALRIGCEVADALDYAHRHGFVHRDIKPGNVLLSGAHAYLCDFGVAHALHLAGDTPVTEAGMVLGTPTYMSPEQGRAAGGIDGRSDIYSLGCVLYEMLAGAPPFTGATARVAFERRLTQRPAPLRQMRQEISASVEVAVERALQRNPEERFQTAAELRDVLMGPGRSFPALDVPTPWEQLPSEARADATLSGTTAVAEPPAPSRVRSAGRRPVRAPLAAMMLGLGFLIGVGVLFGWMRSHAGEGAVGPKRLAVLPFDNLGDSADAYFADGVTDAVRGKLAGVPGLQVIASASTNEYKHTRKSPLTIARELGVTYLLVGKIRWQKGDGDGRVNRVEVSPELIEITKPGAPTTRWQQPFDASLTDVFQVQADIASRVTEALNVALGESQRETLDEPPTHNVAAYDAYLKGEELLKSGVEVDMLRRAAAAYQEAVTLDSTFVAAWAQLSRAHSFLYGNAQIMAAVAAQARTAAERALALAPNRFEGHLALGDYYNYVTGDNARALEQYALAQLTAPNNAQVLSAAALSEVGVGLWDAAVAHFRRALTLDPRATRTAYALARTLLWLRRYPEALQAQDRALALTPLSVAALEDRAMIYLAQGDLAGARTVLRSPSDGVDSAAAFISYVAQTCDLYWVLDEEQQRLLLRLTPEAFDGNRGTWGLALAATHALRADRVRARAYADSARISLQEQLRANPTDAQLHVLLGTALAYLGRRDEAVREGERAIAILPVSKDAFVGAYLQHQLARIYLLVGEPEPALDQLEPLLRIPYYLSPGWLRIDPTFAPLHGNPRFERLVNGS